MIYDFEHVVLALPIQRSSYIVETYSLHNGLIMGGMFFQYFLKNTCGDAAMFSTWIWDVCCCCCWCCKMRCWSICCCCWVVVLWSMEYCRCCYLIMIILYHTIKIDQTQTCIKLDMISMGTGKIIVLLFSAEIPFSVWR